MGRCQLATKICISLSFFSLMPILALSSEPSTPTGTYSNLYYNKDGGDLVGQEIKIIYTRLGYKAFIQISDGGAGSAYFEDVYISKENISIKFRPNDALIESLAGRIQGRSLVGILKYKNGAQEHIALPKSGGYWK